MEEIKKLQDKIDQLEKKIDNKFLFHNHGGNGDQRIQLGDLQELIEVVSAVPTNIPRDFAEQFKIYRNSTTYRFYWHDGTGWRYATGT